MIRIEHFKKDGNYTYEKKDPWYTQFRYFHLPYFKRIYILTPFGGTNIYY